MVGLRARAAAWYRGVASPAGGQMVPCSGGVGCGLGSLRLSELVNRARSVGVPQVVLDELMDGADTKNELISMLIKRSRGRPVPRHLSGPQLDVEELVDSLARGTEDPVAVLKMMVSMCESGLPVNTQPGGDEETAVQLELAAAGATGTVSRLIRGVPDAEEYDRLVQPAVRLLSQPSFASRFPSTDEMAPRACGGRCLSWPPSRLALRRRRGSLARAPSPPSLPSATDSSPAGRLL